MGLKEVFFWQIQCLIFISPFFQLNSGKKGRIVKIFIDNNIFSPLLSAVERKAPGKDPQKII